MMIAIPQDALNQHIAILGKTGSGKSYTGKHLVEWLLKQHRQVVIIDPTSAWWGLRLGADGKSEGFPVVVLGGPKGDVPLPATSGAAVAALVTEQRVSVVIDTSDMLVGERTRWFIDFGNALYRQVRSPLTLVIDEAHLFAPQGKVPDPDTGKMLHAANTLFSGGRSRGIRLIGITQRPAKFHKDALTCVDTLIPMRMLAPQDRSAVKDWIDGCGDPKVGKEVLDSLANLQRGEGWVWYPEGKFLERIKFPKIGTFDSSATPIDNKGRAQAPALKEIDLEPIKVQLKEAVAQAEANDPKKLRARIAELEKQIKAAPKEIPEADIASIRQAAYADGYAQALQFAKGAVGPLSGLVTICDEVRGRIESAWNGVAAMEAGKPSLAQGIMASNTNYALARGENDRLSRNGVHAAPRPAALASDHPTQIDGVTGPMRKILGAILWWTHCGIETPSRVQVAFIAGVSPTSSGYANNVSSCRVAGLLDYPVEGMLELTPDGRKYAESPDISSAADAVARKLNPPLRKLFDALIENGPLTRNDLATRAGVSPTSSGFANNVSSLSGLGIVTYPHKGEVKLAEWIK